MLLGVALCGALMCGTWATAQTTVNRPRLQIVPVELHPHGFMPRQIQRPPGRFLMPVINRTGLDRIWLQLHVSLGATRGAKIVEKETARGTIRWTPLLDLPPGEYELSEINNPTWVLKISVTAQGN
jgi:hypothetical protein